MNKTVSGRTRALACAAALASLLVAFAVAPFVPSAVAAGWNGIEPLKSRRADVERVLGKPIEDKPGQTGTLKFKVAGGTATVAFIDARFVAAHKLSPSLEGTVRQIVLQHESSSATPESMNLTKGGGFEREARGEVAVFRNTREGLAYTFIGNRLRTTYYIAPAAQLARSQTK
ncbi:MAG TPA: hypothetical protein VK421_04620 [Pyrinomonadaceae bacterium]|nr:hypothetical protein [Pyrinomonadaceae bacterium]